ncbi:hypothetical protein ABDD95_14630 [Mucilaginibacter sp. PAMB04274]|uniref:hypothetical protein n=1 Tax=Mucilaginibacter sp. PAMB04274 TaxID=3138568 RepID=UPI0031F60B48
MNWIIRYSSKMEFHTHLNAVLKPIMDEIKGWNWLISDLDYFPDTIANLPVDFERDYFILSSEEFRTLVDANPQIIWGVVLGMPRTSTIRVDEENLPYAEFNELIWKNGNIQHPNAQVEIVCFDSGYTIVKFRDQHLSDKFKAYFEEAIELESFSNDSAPNY